MPTCRTVEAGNRRGNENTSTKAAAGRMVEKRSFRWFQVLRVNGNQNARKAEPTYDKSLPKPGLRSIPIGDRRQPGSLSISRMVRFISYSLIPFGYGKNTIVPNYVTESHLPPTSTDAPGRFPRRIRTGYFFYDRVNVPLYRCYRFHSGNPGSADT